jgi:cystathionine beta-synthase
MRYAKPATVLVVGPAHSGSLSLKFYDDKWMKENGFLETEWGHHLLIDLLATKTMQELITVSTTDRLTDVIALLKAHDISQAPVLNQDGSLAGLVTEVDLLKHMLENRHIHSPDETVAEIVSPTQAVFSSTDTIDAALPAIMEGQVALIIRDSQPVGILTKIDLLDYIAQMI